MVMKQKRIFGCALLAIVFIPVVVYGAILRDLQQGDRGSDVRELQIALNRDPNTRVSSSGAGSPGQETNYFGTLTFGAVKRFQQKYLTEILEPLGLTRPTGYVGERTRLVLNRTVKTSKPVVASTSPAIITKTTEEITLFGESFTKTDNRVLISSEPLGAFTGLTSSDGKSIKFTFRLSAADSFRRALAPFKAKGNYNAVAAAVAANIKERVSGVAEALVPIQVLVANANGQSQPFEIRVNMTKIFEEIGKE